jgi:hypothetical protein
MPFKKPAPFRPNQLIDFRRVSSTALSNIHLVLVRLLLGGRVIGHEYVVRNPRRDDKRPGSFSINLRSGKWADFATGDRGGDVVSLAAFIEGCSQGEAARLLGRMLGMPGGGRHG